MYDLYVIEEFGFTVAECELMFSALNGIFPLMNLPTSAEFLAGEIGASAGESQIDHEKFGLDLGLPRNDSAETPYLMHDLAEKVAVIPDWKAGALRFFAAGFWAGVEANRNR